MSNTLGPGAFDEVGVRDSLGDNVNPATEDKQDDVISLLNESPPTDASKNNASYLISFNAAGEAVYVDEIIAGTTYRTTFTRDDMVIDTTLPISEAVEL